MWCPTIVMSLDFTKESNPFGKVCEDRETINMEKENHTLRLRRLGVDTHQETVIYMRRDCHVCRSEGFTAHARITVLLGERSIIATLSQITSDLLAPEEASLSESAWRLLEAEEGDRISVAHSPTVESLSHLRTKIYGNRLGRPEFRAIIEDVVAGRYSDIHLSSFITACSAESLDIREMIALTQAMVDVGERLTWDKTPIVDKHCIGGLPGNRTTPIVVAIVAACGLTMPKTSSRAITSPAGTADTMETLAPVDLDFVTLRRVVEQEGGCIAWGGSVRLSPADDILIRVERALDLDSEGQLVASVLSKKIAAGATHLVLDLPVGPTAKIRSAADAEKLGRDLRGVGEAFGLRTEIIMTDGTQPVGRRIGPGLEARDVLSVFNNEPDAPLDLRDRSIRLAGAILDLADGSTGRGGIATARRTLESGRAWSKFQAICEAQGGMRIPPVAAYTQPVLSDRTGRITAIDNRLLARVAKLAGAPTAKAAGLELHASLGERVESGSPLFTIHAESPGELSYALAYAQSRLGIMDIEDS